MVTSLNNRPAARDFGYESAQYICARIQANAGGATVNKSVGMIPAGALVVNIYTRVATIFAGGTPALVVGSNSPAFNNLANPAEAQGSEDLMPLATFANPLTADTEIFASLSGGATSGDAYVAVQFLKPLA